jgi:hypothetical protein
VSLGNPLCKLESVGDCGGQKGKAHGGRSQHNALLPHNATLAVAQVMDLIIHHQRSLQPQPDVSMSRDIDVILLDLSEVQRLQLLNVSESC